MNASPRARAARIIQAWLTDREAPTRALAGVRSHHGIVLEIVHGVLRWWRVLAFYRSQLVTRPPSPPVEALLLTGLYQLFFLDRTEDYAVVNDTVELAKFRAGPGAARMVNAVLRRALREREMLEADLRDQPAPVRLSHPDLLFSRWSDRFGAEPARALADWNNRRPELALRIRRDRTDIDGYLDRLREAGIRADPHPYAPDRFIRLGSPARIPELPGYRDGWFHVQDPATSLAVSRVPVRPGMRLLDLCAAPGGKTLALAEGLADGLVAMDVSAERIGRLRENLSRAGREGIPVIQADATDPKAVRRALSDAGADRFDCVLADVPCTSTGVLRRRPDARWRFTADSVDAIAPLQRALLDTAASLVRPDGCIVYSTCSLEPEENEGRVREWLEAHPGWVAQDEQTAFPPESQTDGAYAVRLRAPA